ncbi:MAG: metalloregulator ArsR/SmtB family transcription factor [Protaetiibacter sp.]
MVIALPLLGQDAGACCATVTGGVLDAADAERIARVFKALGDPARVRLLSLIAASPDAELCVCDLTEPVGLSQPTVSHHMKQLVDAGLATREQRGKWAYYRVVDGALETAARTLLPQ